MSSGALNRNETGNVQSGGFSNKLATGKMPAILPSPLYLNLGCGLDFRDGFINIDLYSDNPSVIYMDIRHLELPDNSTDLILASDILEHFSHREVDNVLDEWARVLKPGGELIVRCPSLKLQMKAYWNGIWDADIASYMIFGGQTNPGDFHSIGFDEQSIRKHLSQAGFDVHSFEEIDTPQDRGYINLNMTVRAKKIIAPKQYIKTETLPSLFDIPEDITKDKPQKNVNFTKSENEFSGFNFDLDDEAQIKEKSISTGPQLNIVWEGTQFRYHSLALINREHCMNLIDSGVANLTIVPYEPDQFHPEGNPRFEGIISNDIRNKPKVDETVSNLPYCWIRHQWPPKAEVPQGAKWIIMQPWEFSQLRKDFFEIFSQADEIWTPSNYSRQSFIDSGLDFDKVQVIPNGIDPQLFKPDGEKFNLPTNKKFKFLYVGGTIFRKGIDILLESYIREFNANDDVCLIIKDMGGDSFYKGQTARHTIEKIMSTAGTPEIIYYDNYMTEEEMSSLYRACDVFVCPYRGEGFSLPTLEAMACGLPVIVTEGGATNDFVDEEVGWLLPSKKLEIGNTLDGIELTGVAYLLEPDKEDLQNVIRGVYGEPSIAKNMGIIASLRARTQWTWKRATIKILSRLDYLYGTSMAEQATDILVDYDDSSIIFSRAELEFRNENYNSSLSYFGKCLEFSDMAKNVKVHAFGRLAQILILNNNLPDAENYIRHAELLDENNPDITYLKAIIHQKKGALDDALEVISPLLDNWITLKYNSSLGFTLEDFLLFTAGIYLELGDYDAGHQIYSSILEYNSENSEACYGVGLCFKSAGAADEAKEMFEWAIKLNPNFEEAKRELNLLSFGNSDDLSIE
jgi:glycosyltransferase involved in cell wall biosynthesis/predicted SAM-dependent methyltransferase